MSSAHDFYRSFKPPDRIRRPVEFSGIPNRTGQADHEWLPGGATKGILLRAEAGAPIARLRPIGRGRPNGIPQLLVVEATVGSRRPLWAHCGSARQSPCASLSLFSGLATQSRPPTCAKSSSEEANQTKRRAGCCDFALEGSVRKSSNRVYALLARSLRLVARLRNAYWQGCVATSEGHANSRGSMSIMPPMSRSLGRSPCSQTPGDGHRPMREIFNLRVADVLSHNAHPCINIGIKESGFGDIDQFCCFRTLIATFAALLVPARVFAGSIPASNDALHCHQNFASSKPFDRLRCLNRTSYKLSRLLNCGPCVNVTNKYGLLNSVRKDARAARLR